MQSLKEVITALREEVGKAIACNTALPNNVRLEAERVVVTLGFAVEKEAGQAVVFDFGADAATNSLSIEFRCNVASEPLALGASVAPGKTGTAELTGSEAELVIKELSQVFGEPGFDSSARATVLCEAFENLSGEDSRSLVGSFSASTEPASPATVKRSFGLIKRVCEAGPAGRNDAKKILARIFAEHNYVSVLELIARVWKTQQQWMD